MGENHVGRLLGAGTVAEWPRHPHRIGDTGSDLRQRTVGRLLRLREGRIDRRHWTEKVSIMIGALRHWGSAPVGLGRGGAEESGEGSSMSDDTYPSTSSEGYGGRKISRRRLLQIGAVAGVGTVAGGLAGAQDAAARPEGGSGPAMRFLTGWEFDYVTAMAETIWPTDELGPGAKAAGVGYYLDGQLAGSWGQGHRFYLNGPFYTPADTGHGWQIPMTPSQVYRAFLPAYDP